MNSVFDLVLSLRLLLPIARLLALQPVCIALRSVHPFNSWPSGGLDMVDRTSLSNLTLCRKEAWPRFGLKH